jgi:hypothetical protein
MLEAPLETPRVGQSTVLVALLWLQDKFQYSRVSLSVVLLSLASVTHGQLQPKIITWKISEENNS